MIVVPTSVFAHQPRYTLYRYGCNPNCEAPKADDSSEASDSAAKKKYLTRLIRNPHISSVDGGYEINMDIPGVKTEDVSIQENEGNLSVEAVRKTSGEKPDVKYVGTFSLNTKAMDAAKITASLNNGVLAINIPKKPIPDTFSITPKAMDPPSSHKDNQDLYFAMELPGVKLADLVISVKGEHLSITAERKRESAVSVIKRSFEVDDQAVDVATASAYLVDGVLTIIAPKKTQPDSEEKVGPRSVPINASVAIPENQEVNEINENQEGEAVSEEKDADDSDLPIVETVSEVDDGKSDDDIVVVEEDEITEVH